MLIDHGADIGAKDSEGRTAFQVASGSDMAAELLSKTIPNEETW